MQQILVGQERRRRWSDAEKIAIVVEAAERGVTVSDVARRHDLSRQQIYQWRLAMRQGRLMDENGGPFLTVEFIGASGHSAEAEGPSPDDACGELQIEVGLRKGRALRVPASLSPSVLTALIRATEAA